MRRRLELKAARVRKGWTQLHLALFMSVSQQTVSKWEAGLNAPTSLKQIRVLESVLVTPKETLFPDIFLGGGGGDVGGESGRGFDGTGGRQSPENQPLVSV